MGFQKKDISSRSEHFDLSKSIFSNRWFSREPALKYALAMVFTYFKRAKFYLNEYNRLNFYLGTLSIIIGHRRGRGRV